MLSDCAENCSFIKTSRTCITNILCFGNNINQYSVSLVEQSLTTCTAVNYLKVTETVNQVFEDCWPTDCMLNSNEVRLRSSVNKSNQNLNLTHWAHDVFATLNQRQWRWFNAAKTSCAQWVGTPPSYPMIKQTRRVVMDPVTLWNTFWGKFWIHQVPCPSSLGLLVTATTHRAMLHPHGNHMI